MIRSDAELAVVQKQLARIEHALADLRHDMTNSPQLAVFSEAYIDQIAELKAEIDSYRPAAKKKGSNGRQSKSSRKRQKT